MILLFDSFIRPFQHKVLRSCPSFIVWYYNSDPSRVFTLDVGEGHHGGGGRGSTQRLTLLLPPPKNSGPASPYKKEIFFLQFLTFVEIHGFSCVLWQFLLQSVSLPLPKNIVKNPAPKLVWLANGVTLNQLYCSRN